jgi:site-specific DNA recombinase
MLKVSFDRHSPYRAAAYGRVSHESQNPRSPDQQFDTINAEICRSKLTWNVLRTYRDDGISGRYTNKRPGFQALFRDLRSKALQIDLLLVDTFERLSRAEEGLEIRRKFQKLGVLVLTADSGFTDPTTVQGKALAMVESIRSTEDGRIKAHNVLRGKRDAARQKHWPGGPVPCGYRLRNVYRTHNNIEEIDYRVLEPDPETAWILQSMYQLAFEKGWGATRIAQHLNDDPQIPARVRPIHPATVGTQLSNEIYYGELVWEKHCTGIVDDVRLLQDNLADDWVRVPDFCAPLVSREIWNQVNELRRERGQRQRAAQAAKKRTGLQGLRTPGMTLKYLLSGLVRCAHCRRAMVATSSPVYTAVNGEERRYVSYACTGLSGGLCDNNMRIPEAWLRSTVVNLLRSRLFGAE